MRNMTTLMTTMTMNMRMRIMASVRVRSSNDFCRKNFLYKLKLDTVARYDVRSYQKKSPSIPLGENELWLLLGYRYP